MPEDAYAVKLGHHYIEDSAVIIAVYEIVERILTVINGIDRVVVVLQYRYERA